MNFKISVILIGITLSVGVFYFVAYDLETDPSIDLCSGFEDCEEDGYCAPLNHFEKSYKDENDKWVNIETMVTQGHPKVVRSGDPMETKGRDYRVKLIERKFEGNRIFIIIDLDGIDAGVCRPKESKFISTCPYVEKPDRIVNGKFKPLYKQGFSCI